MRIIPSILQQRRHLVITVAAASTLIWLSLSSIPQITYILPALDLPPTPIPFSSSGRLLPFRYWQHRAAWPERYLDHSCMKLPSVSDLQYAASGWQLVQVDNGSVYVYGAYYDERFEEPLVRILVYTDVAPVPKLFCQLWFPDDNVPQTELATPLYGWRPEWRGPIRGVNEPYVLTCRCRRHYPDKDVPPAAAAVVTAPCGIATNVLGVQNIPSAGSLVKPLMNTSVAVCSKWLQYASDTSLSVVEWMQLLQHFGAQKVYMYVVKLHPNTRRVLKYYEEQGFADVTELAHPPQTSGLRQDRATQLHPNTRRVLKYYEEQGFADVTELAHPPQTSGLRQNRATQDYRDMRRDLLPLNDCLYRSIGHHDWIVAIDFDEIIVPSPEDSWPALIDSQTAVLSGSEDGPLDAMVFPNYFVLDGAQRDLVGPAKARILSHTWRARETSPRGYYVKSFVNVSSVTAMHNHSPIACHDGCRTVDMDQGPGMMLHFRHKCPYDAEDCEELHDVIKDDKLERWRAPVLQEMRAVIKELGLDARLD